jgi:hypothetical protein
MRCSCFVHNGRGGLAATTESSRARRPNTRYRNSGGVLHRGRRRRRRNLRHLWNAWASPLRLASSRMKEVHLGVICGSGTLTNHHTLRVNCAPWRRRHRGSHQP